MTDILLNDRQREAVMAPIGPVLVLAGPGTGKTRVLTERIAYLVGQCGVDPAHVLALAFTNKAAGELSARLVRALGDAAAEAVTTGTFHSFCVGVLRAHRAVAGLPEHFGIADADLQRILIYRAFPRLMPGESNLNNVLQTITRLKRQHRYRSSDKELDFHDDGRWTIDDGKSHGSHGQCVQKSEYLSEALYKPHVPMNKGDAALLAGYEAELHNNHLVDFDDLIFLTHDLLLTHPDLLEDYRNRYQHILVDEFQDTDREQYGLVRLLGENHRCVFAVADDEQSIFGWRDADPENIARFRDAFLQGRPPIVLEENYRSSAEILSLARALIANNPTPFERVVRAQKTGKQVRGLFFDTFQEEGQVIAGDIWERIREAADMRYCDIAVLYPQHAIGAELEKVFMAAHLPCQMAHRRGLFDQPVIRRALSVLRYALDGGDDASLELFLQRELEAEDAALYPAIRAFQRRKKVQSFKQAAFLFSRTAPERDGLTVARALGLAGVVHNAVQRGAVSSLQHLADDILDQLNTSDLPSIKNHLGDIADPRDVPGMDAFLDRALPMYQAGGTFYIACGDEVLRHILTTLVRDALSRPGLTVREAGSRMELGRNALVWSFDAEAPRTSAHFLHAGGLDARFGPVLSALKCCQAIACAALPEYLSDYTAIALGATSADPERADLTAMACVRVRNGAETDCFYTAIGEASDAPTFQEIYLKFQAFVGVDVVVAHNGYAFDFQVLHRLTRQHGRTRLPNPTLDTLPMARSYCADAGRDLSALHRRYHLEVESSEYPALDRARLMHRACEALKCERASRYRRMAFEHVLDQVALGLLFQKPYADGARFSLEDHLHFNLGAQRLLGPANLQIRDLVRTFPRLDADRLRSQARMMLGEDPRPEVLALHAPDQIQRFRDLAARHGARAVSLQAGIRNLLDFADLYKVEADMVSRDAVHLLTLHAAKGLEFRDVYICGLEDRMLPSARAMHSDAELEEQRRLLYVGMTRAMERLSLSCVRHRPGREMVPSRFWEELQLKRDDGG